MSPQEVQAIAVAMTALMVATWLCMSGWASVVLSDKVRAHTGSRRGAAISARLAFLVMGIGGAMAIQWVIW